MTSHCNKYKIRKENVYDFDELADRCKLKLGTSRYIFFVFFIVINHCNLFQGPFLKLQCCILLDVGEKFPFHDAILRDFLKLPWSQYKANGTSYEKQLLKGGL